MMHIVDSYFRVAQGKPNYTYAHNVDQYQCSYTNVLILFSCVMVYIVDHTLGL
jgi:hypothetical protein